MNEANVPFDYSSSYEPEATARADQQPQPPDATESWEAVPLPGMVSPSEIPYAPEAETLNKVPDSTREAELLGLIQDLNRCNEVLLARVNHLEGSLETSQRALQEAVQRSHLPQQDPVTAARQQSVAQLLSELEQANAALSRQTLLAETLQTQLETYQERSTQLERECALLQKHHREKSQRLEQTEDTCRDLRSRLQRQQRYTLQFKAALEKYLDTAVSGHGRSAEVEAAPKVEPFLPTGSIEPVPSVAMPRADSIQPWSVTGAAASTDPQLLSLMRSLKSSDSDASTAATGAVSPEPRPLSSDILIDKEAENQLWQDVERVIETAASTASASPHTAKDAEPTASPQDAEFTEPMPWGNPIAAPSTDLEPIAEAAPAHAVDTQALVPEVVPSVTKPMPQDFANPTAPRQSPTATGHAPAFETSPTSSPAPVVHPSRPPQRKRKSLSAVELPSFPPLPKQPQPDV